MDQDKPFKTIEVLDQDTKQTCKVACMSCIRGHRTTSCGIPVCRTKIFWTVKRPGRPSNSCTCRFSSSGVCKCVTAIPKCPHKPKKGEKRSAECRCDEQGRFCCLLEPNHWETLFALNKPTVRFFPSRDALEAWQISQQSSVTSPTTPSANSFFPSISTPGSSSCCGGGGTATTLTTPRMSRSIAPSPRDSVSSPSSSHVVPRFGFMGVGAPMGPNAPPSEDVMVWNDEALIAPSAYPPVPEAVEPEELGSCCGQRRADDYQPNGTTGMQTHGNFGTTSSQYEPGYSAYSSAPSSSGQYTFDFDRWNQNYHIYQFPNAICQNCGLNGCTCRSCPPLMQNFGTTSWAQSCGRRHARIAPAPPPVQHASSAVQHMSPITKFEAPAQLSSEHTEHQQHFQNGHQDYIAMPETISDVYDHSQISPRPHDLPYLTNGHTITNGFNAHDELMSPEMSDPLHFPDYMVHSLDPAMDENMFGG